jgi:hypothetical protein
MCKWEFESQYPCHLIMPCFEIKQLLQQQTQLFSLHSAFCQFFVISLLHFGRVGLKFSQCIV